MARLADFSRVIVSGGEDCTIRVWQLDTGEELHTWRQHSDGITELLPLPEVADGSGKSVFLSISKDLSVGLFSLQTLHCLQMYVTGTAEHTTMCACYSC
jgi:WD40 repeat protein